MINLPGLLISNIPFVKSKELKNELNEQFRERHGEYGPSSLDPSITLSKIRHLKGEMMNVLSSTIEVSTVALAVVYLEKLILKVRIRL